MPVESSEQSRAVNMGAAAVDGVDPSLEEDEVLKRLEREQVPELAKLRRVKVGRCFRLQHPNWQMIIKKRRLRKRRKRPEENFLSHGRRGAGVSGDEAAEGQSGHAAASPIFKEDSPIFKGSPKLDAGSSPKLFSGLSPPLDHFPHEYEGPAAQEELLLGGKKNLQNASAKHDEDLDAKLRKKNLKLAYKRICQANRSSTTTEEDPSTAAQDGYLRCSRRHALQWKTEGLRVLPREVDVLDALRRVRMGEPLENVLSTLRVVGATDVEGAEDEGGEEDLETGGRKNGGPGEKDGAGAGDDGDDGGEDGGDESKKNGEAFVDEGGDVADRADHGDAWKRGAAAAGKVASGKAKLSGLLDDEDELLLGKDGRAGPSRGRRTISSERKSFLPEEKASARKKSPPKKDLKENSEEEEESILASPGPASPPVPRQDGGRENLNVGFAADGAPSGELDGASARSAEAPARRARRALSSDGPPPAVDEPNPQQSVENENPLSLENDEQQSGPPAAAVPQGLQPGHAVFTDQFGRQFAFDPKAYEQQLAAHYGLDPSVPEENETLQKHLAEAMATFGVGIPVVSGGGPAGASAGTVRVVGAAEGGTTAEGARAAPDPPGAAGSSGGAAGQGHGGLTAEQQLYAQQMQTYYAQQQQQMAASAAVASQQHLAAQKQVAAAQQQAGWVQNPDGSVAWAQNNAGAQADGAGPSDAGAPPMKKRGRPKKKP